MDEIKKEYPQEEEAVKAEPERQDWWPTGDEEPEPVQQKEKWPSQPDEESGVYSSVIRRKDYIGPEPVRETVQEKPAEESCKTEETEKEKRTRTNFDPNDYDYRDGQKTSASAADRTHSYSAQYVSAERNPFVTAAVVLGILSILFMVTGIGGLFFGGLGVITAVLSRGRGAVRGKAKAGLFLSLFGFMASLVITISAFNMIFRMTTAEMKDLFRQYGYVLELPEEAEESPFPSGILEDAEDGTEIEEKPEQGFIETAPFADPSHAVEL